MTDVGQRTGLESQIDQWRGFVSRRRAITAPDVAEMEDHLREQVTDLNEGGLDDDEAFLVAVKRMGRLDDVSREFAQEHSDRLWKQLMLFGEHETDGATAGSGRFRDLGVLLALAIGAGIALKILLASIDDETTLMLNGPFVVLPFLAGYLTWKRAVPWRTTAVLLAATTTLALAVNLYPFDLGNLNAPYPEYSQPGMTVVLAVLHAPIVLWLLLGVIYAGGSWRSGSRRMDFVRFTGELLVYLALITLGGMLLIGLTFGVLGLVNINFEPFLEEWLVPFAVPGAFMVAAWLVEAKKSTIENIAPVLARVFTPLAALMLLAMFVALIVGGPFDSVDRELLILMDAVLLLVLFLLLYSISARDPQAPPGIFDWLQLVLVGAALAVDAVALTAMLVRIAEFGFTANKVAALGLNLILLIHLVWAGRLALGFVRGTRTFAATERWQTRYLPVYGLWALTVVVLFPPVFGFA